MPRDLLADRPAPRDLLADIAPPKPKAAPRPDSSSPYFDAAASMASSAALEPMAGLSGLRTLLTTGDPARAAQSVEDVRGKAYVPDAPNSQRVLKGVSDKLKPVTDFLGRAQDQAGAIGESVGGPVGGAIGETIPTALLMLAGVRRAPAGAPKVAPISNVAERQIISAGDAEGIPVFTSDVKQPTTWLGKQAQTLGEKIPFAGTSGPRATQQAAREAAVDNIANKYGQFSYPEIVKSLRDQKDKIKVAAGNVLNDAGQDLDAAVLRSPNMAMPLPKTQKAVADMASALAKSNVAQASSKAMNDLETMWTSLRQAQTFTSLKENRTTYRALKDGIDPATGSQMPSNTKRMAEAVYHAMSEDMDDFARTNLAPVQYNKWKRANDVYAGEAQRLTRTRLKQVLDTGDLTPENVQGLLFSQKPSEVRLLHAGLTQRGRANARAAIISKVVKDVSKRKDGLAPDQFLTELNKYKDATDTFFKGTDRQQLEGLRRVLDATRRAQQSAANPPTGQSTIPLLAMFGIGATGVKGAAVVGTLGGLARLYESAPVRNALLRLSKTPPSGPAFESELVKTRAAIVSAADALSADQAAQDQGQPEVQ